MFTCCNRACKWNAEEKPNGCTLFAGQSIKECKSCLYRAVSNPKKESRHGKRTPQVD